MCSCAGFFWWIVALGLIALWVCQAVALIRTDQESVQQVWLTTSLDSFFVGEELFLC